ncbi:MAG: hypothetical protein LQ350_007645 [Teloschistes chrysophthalmus]|nr:MAG: hypothetical protein LQ350_007645 [Niorma chrysophthalma]
MDIARSIDFDTLNRSVHDLSRVPTKDSGIDVNRQFDLYTTTTTDAPPVYQKDQPRDGAFNILGPQSDTLESCKPPSARKYILKTVNRPPSQPWDVETNHARRSGQISRSSQHPEIVPVPKPHDPLSSAHLGHGSVHLGQEDVERQHEEETTVLCEMTGATMDYTQPDESMPGKMGLVKGASTCTVRVTTRRKRVEGDDFRVVRSIWTIADDGKTCIQQKCRFPSYTHNQGPLLR